MFAVEEQVDDRLCQCNGCVEKRKRKAAAQPYKKTKKVSIASLSLSIQVSLILYLNIYIQGIFTLAPPPLTLSIPVIQEHLTSQWKWDGVKGEDLKRRKP